ncbi:BrnT family toxin [Marinimicrobium sp. ARAG 43.8]|uniref:BrnT family toxin n=1 Tax=Marinimicrobium sp. ARAG 43.8 TaxID=3418719 RepID=UPI003CF13002
MLIDYDPQKNNRNIQERALPFDRARDFDFETALFSLDERKDYGETRVHAIGFLGERLHVLLFVEIRGGIRVISFRKANRREVKRYEQATQP